MTVHNSIKQKLARRIALKAKLGFRLLFICISKNERLVAELDSRSVPHESVIHFLKRCRCRRLKNNPAPSRRVRQKRGMKLAIHDKFIDIPNAVKLRFRSPTAILFPRLQAPIDVHGDQVKQDADLGKECKTVCTYCLE